MSRNIRLFQILVSLVITLNFLKGQSELPPGPCFKKYGSSSIPQSCNHNTYSIMSSDEVSVGC